VPHSRVEWAERIATATDWLLPSECVACARPVAGTPPPLVCQLCRVRWRSLPEPACPRCQQPRLLDLTCRTCTDWPPELERVRSAVLLDHEVRRLVHAFKYHQWRRLAVPFAARMAPLLVGDAMPGVLVPLPTDRGRRWRRGYDQAVELARALGAQTGRKVDPSRLVRVRRASSQVRLTPEQRLANLAGVFAAGPQQDPVVLVDDVFTTGASLLSAALALRAAGVAVVGAVTFARAEPPLVGAERTMAMSPSGSERF
jgi:predicted amidophosphoribosyltransferase